MTNKYKIELERKCNCPEDRASHSKVGNYKISIRNKTKERKKENISGKGGTRHGSVKRTPRAAVQRPCKIGVWVK